MRSEKGKVKNNADPLLRVTGDTKSRKKNDADLLLRVRRDEKRTEKMMQTCC